MKKQIILGLVSVMIFSSFIENNTIEQNQNVYICSNPKLKCYYTRPCKDFSDFCSKAKGKIYKVSLKRAKALGKEKCDCGEI
jgi:hypothetical protein